MSISDYIHEQRANIDSIKNIPLFAVLGSLVDRLYDVALNSVPTNSPPDFGKHLVLCHKSFLAAITLIGQGQPEDAAPITRRAIEIARVTFAWKINPKSAENWVDFDKRMKRWKAREDGTKPPSYSPPHLGLPRDHKVLAELDAFLGSLSDLYVHFTPEFSHFNRWQKVSEGDLVTLYLKYFTSDQEIIENELILLSDIHGYIILLFDECLNGIFKQDEKWRQTFSEFKKVSDRLKAEYAAKHEIESK